LFELFFVLTLQACETVDVFALLVFVFAVVWPVQRIVLLSFAGSEVHEKKKKCVCFFFFFFFENFKSSNPRLRAEEDVEDLESSRQMVAFSSVLHAWSIFAKYAV
jgi:hypothetical protein